MIKNKPYKLLIIVLIITACSQTNINKEGQKDLCQKYNEKSVTFYSNYYVNKDEKCLDSALYYIDEIIQDCDDYLGLLSLRKLSILSEKRDYNTALSFIETFDEDLFNDLPYFQNLLKNRFLAMKAQYYGDFNFRDSCLNNITVEINNYLIANKVEVDSLVTLSNLKEIISDPLCTAITEYYYYRSVTEGSETIELELKNYPEMNKEFNDFLISELQEDFMVFSGF